MEYSKILKLFSLRDLRHGENTDSFNHNAEVIFIRELLIWSNIQMQLKR